LEPYGPDAALRRNIQEPVFDASQPLHGGTTPDDADIIANEQDRVVNINGINCIVGQDFEKGDPDNKQIVGVVTAPMPCKPNVYSNTSRNAKAAKHHRLDLKAREFKAVAEDIKKLKTMVGEATGGKEHRAIFSTKRIQRWAEEFLHWELLKSKKWSLERTQTSIENLMTQVWPEYKLKCAVKLENMNEGKPPRLLIADGDDGQLMALVIIKCFEDLLFEWMESKSIKHAGKREAVVRVVESLKKAGACLIEADGSAWDTTCGEAIRELCENPVLRHIMQTLMPYGFAPDCWYKEHDNCCSKKTLKLFFSKKLDKVKFHIAAIRRSGHRGTSCLNWWVNFTNWACSVFKQPERFLTPTTRNGEDVTGRKRWWNGAFEGDDSICALSPPMVEGDELSKLWTDYWERVGFNMVPVYADGRATFCGYHIACNKGEPTGVVCPELPRAMKNAGVSCSPTIILAAKGGDIRTVKDIAAAGALSRAADFAGILPSVSRKYHAYANELKQSSEVVDREMSMRVMGKEGHHYTEIEALIEAQNNLVTPTEEMETLRALECSATLEELDTFTLHAWTFEGVCDYESHRAALPRSWRPALK